MLLKWDKFTRFELPAPAYGLIVFDCIDRFATLAAFDLLDQSISHTSTLLCAVCLYCYPYHNALRGAMRLKGGSEVVFNPIGKGGLDLGLKFQKDENLEFVSPASMRVRGVLWFVVQ